ncbi:MAG: sigma-70 family RNA polymerase sigma factor [Erysipelotrichaceae bacterium]|nr:sigma-70 family RNA polymerase sigma factor [Erysipelotrichaceae bacterium]MCI9524280.1 sigma-70 family RNA polymerase sigma factor [Erysipelotrichaceae bacterium]
MKKQMDVHSDEYYVKKAQSGDAYALEKLFEKYHNLAYYIALKICHCDADAEDIVQESFIEIERSIHKLNEPKYFKAWLNRIIFSKSTRLFRKNKDVNMRPYDDTALSQITEERRYLLPKQESKFQSDREVMLSFVDQLPDKLRVTLYLMYFEELSVKEIAMILQIPDGTVKSRISSAKTELRTMIRSYEDKEGVKLDFRAHALESVLAGVFLKEYAAVMKANHVSWISKLVPRKLQSIPPITYAAFVCSVVVLGATSYAIVNSFPFSDNVSTTSVQQYTTFPIIEFQGRKLTNAKEAYEALINIAHCSIELEEIDDDLLKEMKKVYMAIKHNDGVYYELLLQKGYADNFE